MFRRRDAEAGVEREVGDGAGTGDQARERWGEIAARTRRSGQRDEVEPAVRLRCRDPDALVGRRGRDELDSPEPGALPRGEIRHDQARRPGGSSVFREALPAVRLEERGVRHRDQGRVWAQELAGVREAIEAGACPHSRGEGSLGGTADHGAVRERIREREAELDDVRSSVHGCRRELRRLGARHQVDDEVLHGFRRTASMCSPPSIAACSAPRSSSIRTRSSRSSGVAGCSDGLRRPAAAPATTSP